MLKPKGLEVNPQPFPGKKKSNLKMRRIYDEGLNPNGFLCFRVVLFSKSVGTFYIQSGVCVKSTRAAQLMWEISSFISHIGDSLLAFGYIYFIGRPPEYFRTKMIIHFFIKCDATSNFPSYIWQKLNNNQNQYLV